jgi:transcriptional regulator with XRE-family HTH domain
MTNCGRVNTEQDVCNTIRGALDARGLTQAALARRMGASKGSVHAWVHGDQMPRLDTLERIAEALDTTVQELLAGRWRRVRREVAQ